MNQFTPKEYKVALRECPTPAELQLCDTPEKAVQYWNSHIVSSVYHDPKREILVTLLLNTRRRNKGHCLISIGTSDTILVDPKAVFRPAVTASAAAIVLAHTLAATPRHRRLTSK